MAVNKYFQSFQNTNEQELVSRMYAESIQIRGFDVQYIKRSRVNEDYLYGEDPASAFEEAFTIEMYMESFEGFGADMDFMSKFGLHIKDRITLDVSGFRFTEETGMEKPLEGDLIWFPLARALFEVRHVEDEEQFYALGKTYNYKIQAQLFEYTHEDFDTGIEDVDSIQAALDDSVGGEDPYGENENIEIDGAEVIDFTEKSPFGSF